LSLEIENDKRKNIGIYSDGKNYSAVGIDIDNNNSQFLKYKKTVSEISLCDFIAEVKKQSPHESEIVYGVDSWSILFNTLQVPDLPAKQLAKVVEIQLNSILPTYEYGYNNVYQNLRNEGGLIVVNTATVKKDFAEKQLSNLEQFPIDKTIISAQADVAFAREKSGMKNSEYLQVSFYDDHLWVYSVYDSKFACAVAIDESVIDAKTLPSQVMLIRREIESAIEKLKENVCACDAILLCNYTDCDIREIEKYLQQKEYSVTSLENLGESCLAIAAGVALSAQLPSGNSLNPVEKSRVSSDQIAQANRSKNLVWAAIFCVVSAVAMFSCFYGGGKIYASKLEEIATQEDVAVMVTQHQLRKEIAKYRVDPVDLLKRITKDLESGVKIDSIKFTRGKKVVLVGKSKDVKKIYAFQSKLNGDRAFGQVRIQNQSKDKKSKMNKFSIVFDYKDFSKKRSR